MVKEFKQKLLHVKNKLRQFRSRRDVYGAEKYSMARKEFHELLKRQEIYWQQRAKQFWLREGDQNTRFFHKHASSRRRNNTVIKLKDKDGVWLEAHQDVQQIIIEYFENLYTTSGSMEGLTEREVVSTVTVEQNEFLLVPTTLDEVKKAIFSMHGDKSPGPDGLNPTFYQSFLAYSRG